MTQQSNNLGDGMSTTEEQLDKQIDDIVLRCFMQGQYYGTASGVVDGEESGELNPDYEPEKPIDRDQAVKELKSLLSQHTQRDNTRLDIGEKTISFSHTAVNKDAHLFIDGVHDPYVCPECVQPGILSFATKDSTNKEER